MPLYPALPPTHTSARSNESLKRSAYAYTREPERKKAGKAASSYLGRVQLSSVCMSRRRGLWAKLSKTKVAPKPPVISLLPPSLPLPHHSRLGPSRAPATRGSRHKFAMALLFQN
ncbi:hypoxanthine-guanine phosphoribosyltransferase [Platysternon megacephalum]|uniref:Hypoxanthine-guanine phosphoribosyltransferase n=1 Tax=Platysternon megacephalum TaxID=55544 RepID=A0A4D9FBM9_9SAUR|nr:hypoxanthine-guanine phosphoribosyltransferase [Platysternon megacephalum]